MSSPNHFHLVIAKKRHFSITAFDKMLKLLKLNTRDKQFAKLLFLKEVEKKEKAKKDLEEQIALLRNTPVSPDLRDDQYRLISNSLAWYIKMGALAFDGLAQVDLINKVKTNCKFPLSDETIDQAIHSLVEMELLKIDEGICRFDFANITTKWDYDRFEIKNHHVANLQLAMQTVSWPIDQRFFSSVTIPCNQQIYEMMIKEIRNLCLKILEESDQKIVSPSECQQVTTLQFSLFPYFNFKKI